MSKWKKQGRWLLEFKDETSSSDFEGRWAYGSECMMRTYRAWIPNAIKLDDYPGQMDFLDRHPNAFVKP